MSDKTEKKYMKKSEIVTFGIGLFGVALMTGWMPDYTATFFADFAFKGKGFDSATMANAISMVFLVAGIIGANVAYAAQTDSTLNKILMIYTIIPAVFVVLQAVPIFFYDMVGEKKARITRELMERREAAGLVAGEGEETADAAAAE